MARVLYEESPQEDPSNRRTEFFKGHFNELPKPIDTSLSLQQILQEAAYVKKRDVEINAELDELLSTRDRLTKNS
eukprot:TRINITY_DN8095_c0_g1_i1.p1 TRINITY_DN8095_c0_g1~~TRINITY_DN8095_c0_g1_i1.p1  ORF type:complete len:75 (-),score=8.43 TRINITY_DN8095_c0_g1_i1:127-351(-)